MVEWTPISLVLLKNKEEEPVCLKKGLVVSFTRFSRLLEISLVAKYLIILNFEGTGKYGQQYRLSAHRIQLVSSDKSDTIVKNHSCMK